MTTLTLKTVGHFNDSEVQVTTGNLKALDAIDATLTETHERVISEVARHKLDLALVKSPHHSLTAQKLAYEEAIRTHNTEIAKLTPRMFKKHFQNNVFPTEMLHKVITALETAKISYEIVDGRNPNAQQRKIQ